jgi:hypothetical protein
MCELPSVFVLDTPKARKPHKCCECRGVISPGEKYHYIHGVWAGYGAVYKVCNECDALRSKVDVDTLGTEECTPFGALYESVFESGDPDYIKTFMATKRKRGALIQPWMIEREAELTAPKGQP